MSDKCKINKISNKDCKAYLDLLNIGKGLDMRIC